jgi:hypothetical protein
MAGNKPAVFKYFILPEKIPDDGNVRTKCSLCVSYISGNVQKTSNTVEPLHFLTYVHVISNHKCNLITPVSNQ